MKTKRFLALLLCLCMVVAMLSTTAFAVSEKAGIGTNANTYTDMEIKYGGQSWVVIGYDGTGVASGSGTITLLAKKSIGDNVKFSDINNVYATSDLKTAVETIAASFSVGEQAAIRPRTLAVGTFTTNAPCCDGVATTQVDNALLWPLSSEEARHVSQIDVDCVCWWLRSPGNSDKMAACVVDIAILIGGNDPVTSSYGVRPAFNLNLSSVLFTSATTGGKSGTAGAALTALADASGVQKLTIIDAYNASANPNGLKTGTVTVTGADNNANTGIKVNVTGATANKSVSAIIKNSTGTISYYGKIGETDANGEASNLDLTLPVTLSTGGNTLEIFVENLSGDNITDYASTPVAVMVDVTAPTVSGVTPANTAASLSGNISITFSEAMDSATAGTVSLNGGTSLTSGSWSTDKLTYTIPYSGLTYSTAYTVAVSGFKDAAGNTMTADSGHGYTTMAAPPAMMLGTSGISGSGANWVYYGEYSGSPVMWRVLDTNNDYDSTTGGTQSALFLLSEYLLDSGHVTFNTASNVWQGSAAQTWCTSFASTTNFSNAELAAVAETNKSDSAVNGYGTSNLSNDKVFFLSYEEVHNSAYGFTDDTKLIAKIGSSTGTPGSWWLRSGYAQYASAAGIAGSAGDVGFELVSNGHDARPAFNLNPNSVLFTSAAAGGKSSGTAGVAALNSVSSTTPTEWKLTLTDSSRSFAVTDTAAQTVAQGANASVSYTGSTVGSNEYVSAIIVDGSNNILYYGRIADKSTGDANGTAAVTIPSGLAVGSYTLKVFSEQYNGDYKTDYASAFSNVALTVVAAPVYGGGSDTSTPTYKAEASDTGLSGTSLLVNVNTSVGSAAVDLGAQGEGVFSGKEAKITIPTIPGVNTYTLDISASSLSSSQEEGSLTFATGSGSIVLPDNMLSGISGSEGKKAGISIGQGDKSGLPDRVKTAIGDRPLVQLTLTLDGTQTAWNNPDAPVTATIPYTPTAAELADPEHITVWYVDGAGNAVSIPSGRYDTVTGMVTFSTTHFSNFAVVYVTKTFDDLESAAWAKTQIEVLASKGILQGTSETAYCPQTSVTRADYLYCLVRTLGVDAVTDGNFDDISSDAYYCKEIAIAKKLGITTGTGSNKFGPDASITRQDMIVMTERALKLLNKTEVQGTASDLDKFADKYLISSYAVNSVASVVKEGLIVGSGNKINPLGSTTRAETAVFLYRIYNNYPR